MHSLRRLFIIVLCVCLAAPCFFGAVSAENPASAASFSRLSEAALPVNVPVSARSAVLMEATGGDRCVLYEKNGSERLGMASTTKIMTALVAAESLPLSAPITVPKEAVGVEGSSVWLCEGEELTLGELLLCVLLSSANDAAAAVAISVGGSIEGFADMMNAKAEVLGMHDTHFVNPHGLDAPGHYTTAGDLALLAAAALDNDDFRRMVSTWQAEVPGTEGTKRRLTNHNRMLRSYDGAIGVKTGYTKACGRCLVSAAERDGVRLVAVTLDDPDDWNDHAGLLDAGFDSYERVALNREPFFVPVIGGEQNTLLCTAGPTVNVILPVSHGKIESRIEMQRWIPAPVRAGDTLGYIYWYCDGRQTAVCEIRAAYSAAREHPPGLRQRMRAFFGFE